MSGLIVFIHGFRGDQEHWGYVPDLVDVALSTFTVVNMTYSAEYNSFADMTRSGEQILTRIKTEHPSDEPIFLIGYSMGGIIAREICLKLLNSETDKLWLEKIRATITVGTPLCGLQRTLDYGTSVVGTFLSSKVSQVKDGNFIFGRYSEAIQSASRRGINGPKQIHIEIENDGVSAPHDTSLYTRDDNRYGVIPGEHRNFLPTKAHERRLANIIVGLIRERHSALARAERRLQSKPKVDLPDRLLLIACSNRKQTGGNAEYGGPGPANWIADPELRERVLSKRSQVLSLLKDAKIDNGFEKAENRLHQAPNRTLQRGPDFGGVLEADSTATYLPAYQRYSGRCYAQINPKSWEHYFERNHDKLFVLIMSGLYGLIESAEWIQEYDIHLTDRILDTGIPISAMWRDLYTNSVVEYVQRAYRNRKVLIMNCLCDEYYVDSINWHQLPSECSAYHLASPNHRDTNLLPPAGTIIDCLLNNPTKIDSIKRTTREEAILYPISDFGAVPENHAATRIAFEARIGDLKERK